MKPEQQSISLPNPNTRLAAARDDGEAVAQCSIECPPANEQAITGNSRDASGTMMGISRRKALLSGGGILAAATMLKKFDAAAAESRGNTTPNLTNVGREIGMVTMKDGATIFFKDWGSKNAQPIVFHHGWPLSGDDWDAQMLYFVQKGYRVIAHDRRGHGRSSQVTDGHDMDHYAADVAAVVSHLGLRNAIHIGHSTGGGEALHYAARYGQGRVAKLVLVGAVPPIMLKTVGNPEGIPIEVFDGFRKQLAANRAQFYLDIASGPFFGFNRTDAKVSEAVIQNWGHSSIG